MSQLFVVELQASGKTLSGYIMKNRVYHIAYISHLVVWALCYVKWAEISDSHF